MKEHFEIILPGYMPTVLFAPADVSFCGKRLVDYVFHAVSKTSISNTELATTTKAADVLLAPSLVLKTYPKDSLSSWHYCVEAGTTITLHHTWYNWGLQVPK